VRFVFLRKVVDELLVKYGATMVGYSVVAFPVFGGTYNTRLSGTPSLEMTTQLCYARARACV
jgi:hypothetical protein